MALLPAPEARDAAQALDALFAGAWSALSRAERQERGFDAATWDRLVADEWHLLGVPRAQGGGGLEVDDLVGVAEVVGRWLVPLPLLPTILVNRWRAHRGLAPVTAATFGIEAGDEAWAPFADVPDIALVSLDGAAVTRTPAPSDDFAYSLPLAAVSGSTVLVDPDALREAAILLAAASVGAADEAMRRAADYAKGREQFGRPIGSFQAVAHQLADAYTQVSLARTCVGWAVSEPDVLARAVNAALKLSVDAVEGAIHVHGGIGFTWDAGLHFNLRHVLQTRKLLHEVLRAVTVEFASTGQQP